MITLDEFYMGRDKTYASQLTDTIKANAAETVKRVNELLEAFGECRKVNSGWRPPEVNAGTAGAAKRSKHMRGLACDIADADGKLDKFCLENQDVLERIGLWLEHPNATKNPARFGEGWCHVQTVPPNSRRRVFYP
jgi:D-alanyl-D-alanine dipeptidase